MKQSKESLFKNASTTYFYSSLFFPKDAWENVSTIYAYVRTADDFVDKYPQDLDGFIEFIQETKQICFAYNIAISKTGSITTAIRVVERVVDENEYSYIIQPFVRLLFQYHIPLRWVTSFLSAMASDVAIRNQWIRYKTRKELENYVYGSAEVIGLMMCKILGIHSSAHYASQKQGSAMQHINFIRDIAEDCTLKRVYFPSKSLEKFGVKTLCKKPETEQEINAFNSFLKQEILLFTKAQTEAETSYSSIPYRYRVPIATAASLYMWTASVIEKDPMLIYKRKVKPTRLRVFITLIRIAVRELFRK
jgi:phytoene synthase